MSDDRTFISAAESQPPYFVGIDLGGQSIKVGLVDDLGRPIAWMNIPTDVEKGPENGARRMGACVLEVIERAGVAPAAVARVGLGSPGEVDIPTGMLFKLVNLPGWDNFPIRDRVSHFCGLGVSFENDANAAAYGEFWVGSGRDFKSMVLLTLGTGIGCGIILGDLVVQGANSHGGEAGHIVIDASENARLCSCGRRGHLEAYASAIAVVRRAHELLDSGRNSTLARHAADGDELTPKLIGAAAETGDELAIQIVMETARYLGIGAVNLIATLEPAAVLLGGAMTFGGGSNPLGARFIEHLRETVRSLAPQEVSESTVIEFATLGGDAGYIGAAGVARLDYSKYF